MARRGVSINELVGTVLALGAVASVAVTGFVAHVLFRDPRRVRPERGSRIKRELSMELSSGTVYVFINEEDRQRAREAQSQRPVDPPLHKGRKALEKWLAED